jgi:hypothetical protein
VQELFVPGSTDPRPLTSGPRYPRGQATLARSGWVFAPVTGGDQEEAALGRGKAQERTLPGQRLTGETPAGSAWPEEGRRRGI